MSQRLWLLVEWVDERNVFPSYGVVNVGSLIGNETQLHVGKLIFVRDKHGNNTRRAQVLRISDNKSYVKEQKKLLEREDHQVKNVLSLCMRTIREMKSGSMYTGLMTPDQPPIPSSSGASALPQVVADSDSTSSESDPENHYEVGKRHKKQALAQNIHFNRDASSSNRNRPSARHQGTVQRSRSMVCSTPVSVINGTLIPTLTFDQGTQTDPIPQQSLKERIEEMEIVIKGLYSRFMALVSQIQDENAIASLSIDMSDGSEQNDVNLSESEQNGLHPSPNQISGTVALLNLNLIRNPVNGEINSGAQMLQVRRVSAHTTNTGEPNDNEMVPIGAGNTVVPSRLLNDIDWTSYSTATRQLLQAVFPRRVLATHSLTGKQSPAFMNKPPKQRLDPLVVNDIVDTVAQRCGVSKRLVRSSVTIKCTDESKLYRNRQQLKHARQESQNQEHMPPALPSSDESSDDRMNL